MDWIVFSVDAYLEMSNFMQADSLLAFFFLQGILFLSRDFGFSD